MSFTIPAPAATAAVATAALVVSTEITAFVFAASPRMTGITRRISSSTGTGMEPGRVDSPPTSRIAAPSASISNPRATASSTDRYAPPSEKESGVTFRIPMTRGRPDRSRTPPGIGTRNAFAGCGAMTGRPPRVRPARARPRGRATNSPPG